MQNCIDDYSESLELNKPVQTPVASDPEFTPYVFPFTPPTLNFSKQKL